jgi:endonuclease/exonuclease/phosphatase family metal-dependent hydrolase
MVMATLGMGDVAFTGFQGTINDKVSIVLLKDVDSGTVLTVTDNAWSGSSLSTTEGSSTIVFNAAFAAGTQLNYDATRADGQRWAVGTSPANIVDTTTGSFALSASGENLFVYSGQVAPTSGSSSLWVAAFATNPFLTSGTATASLTYLPSIFTGSNAHLSLGISAGANNQNGVYSGGSINGSVTQIRGSVHNVSNWTTFTSAGGQAIPPNVTFTITDVSNRAPTGLQLSNNSLVENSIVNTVVGSLTTLDPDVGDSFLYALVDGIGSSDNSKFSIVGNSLRAIQAFDFETQNRFSVRIRSTDQGGLWFEQAFGIQLFDENETAQANLRIVSYNIASSGSGGVPRSGLDTILHGIASEMVGGIARYIDLLALQEVASQATTSSIVAGMLNSRYGESIYSASSLDGASTGSGTQGIVYNTKTLQLLGESLVGTSTTTGQPRQTVRYHLQPVGGVGGSDFYVYNSHWKSADDADSRNRRLLEAQAIRADADLLGEGRNVFYVGDFNVYTGSELSFQQMIGVGNGQAFDPLDRVGSWSDNVSFVDTFTQAPAVNPPGSLTGGGLDDRFDFQLLSGELFDGSGLEYRSGTYHAFGNNGSVAINSNINDGTSTALIGLFDRSAVLDLLTTVSDHLPVVSEVTYLVDALINHPPEGSDKAILAGEGQPYTFAVSDFGFSDPNDLPPDSLDAVMVSTLPSMGQLTLNGQFVAVGQVISASDIGVGNFRYIPPANISTRVSDSFSFQVRDNGGTDLGGVNLDPIPNTIQVDVLPTPGVTVTSSGTTTSEAGASATISLVLESQPTANVSIPIVTSDSTEGSADVAEVIFTPTNWFQSQSVIIRGVDDLVDDGDVPYFIDVRAAISGDLSYNGLDPSNVSLLNLDNDDALVTRFFVVNDGTPDRTFEYAADGKAIRDYGIDPGNTQPRGIVASSNGATLWVIDRNRNVYVYSNSGARLGLWTAGTLPSTATVEGIATDGKHIWIVDSKTDRIYFYSGAATRLSGSQAADTSYLLASGNTNPKDLVYGKDANENGMLWVVNDASTDKVFRYSVDAATFRITALNSWNLNSGNKVPTGITLDPSATGGDLWVVDNGSTKQVFRYTGGRTGTAPQGVSVFRLSSANSNPQGIADPPPAVSVDTILANWDSSNPNQSSVKNRKAEMPQTAALVFRGEEGLRYPTEIARLSSGATVLGSRLPQSSERAFVEKSRNSDSRRDPIDRPSRVALKYSKGSSLSIKKARTPLLVDGSAIAWQSSVDTWFERFDR